MMVRLRNATSDTFRSLRTRNFRLFFSGQLISQVGNWLTLVAQVLLVLKLTDNGLALGALAAFQFGPVLLFGPFAGLVADRSDKRKLLLIVQSFAMLQSFALATLALMNHPSLAALYGIAFLGGIATAFDNPARRSFVVEMVPPADINNAVSLNSALMTGSRVVGPALAGLLVVTVGYSWTFFLDGVSYLAVLAGLMMMNPAELRRPPAAPRGRGQVREGLRYARGNHELWVPLVMMALIGTLAFNFQTVLPLFTTRDLHGSAVTFTLLMSIVSVGSLIGALATARRTTITVSAVSRAAVGFGIAMALLAVAPNQPVAFAFGLVLGLTSIAFMTASTAIVQLKADPSMRGRVLALQAIVFLGSTPIGGPVVGFVSEHWGARYGLVIGAVAGLGAGVYGLMAVARARAGEALQPATSPSASAPARDHLVGEPVADRVLAPQDVVTVDVGGDALARLPGGGDEDLHHPSPHLDHLRHR
jgi:MFS family permease